METIKNTNKYNRISSKGLIDELKNYLEEGEANSDLILERMAEPYKRLNLPLIESSEAAICCAKIAIDQYLLQRSIDSINFQIKDN